MSNHALWHRLRFDFRAGRFRVSFNGEHLFEVQDSTFLDAGTAGIWTNVDSVTLFDRVNDGAPR